jgi:hypothetical protein
MAPCRSSCYQRERRTQSNSALAHPLAHPLHTCDPRTLPSRTAQAMHAQRPVLSAAEGDGHDVVSSEARLHVPALRASGQHTATCSEHAMLCLERSHDSSASLAFAARVACWALRLASATLPAVCAVICICWRACAAHMMTTWAWVLRTYRHSAIDAWLRMLMGASGTRYDQRNV